MNNRAIVEAHKLERGRPKTKAFDSLLNIVGDPDMAEMMWIFLGESSLKVLDDPAPALNLNRKWWMPFIKKNTMRALLRTEKGREQVWRMLHEASAWLL